MKNTRIYICPQTTVLCTAIIIPVQDVPFPLKPVLHVHVKLPSLFVQSALASQLLPPPGAHSSISNDHHTQYVNIQYHMCLHMSTNNSSVYCNNHTSARCSISIETCPTCARETPNVVCTVSIGITVVTTTGGTLINI